MCKFHSLPKKKRLLPTNVFQGPQNPLGKSVFPTKKMLSVGNVTGLKFIVDKENALGKVSVVNGNVTYLVGRLDANFINEKKYICRK